MQKIGNVTAFGIMMCRAGANWRADAPCSFWRGIQTNGTWSLTTTSPLCVDRHGRVTVCLLRAMVFDLLKIASKGGFKKSKRSISIQESWSLVYR